MEDRSSVQSVAFARYGLPGTGIARRSGRDRRQIESTTVGLPAIHASPLMAAFEGLRRDASAGVDEVTYQEYEQDVWRNIPTLHHRLVSHQYRVQPLRRVYIPKENGKERPISIPALEDKIVQKATVTVFNAIYEQDFLPCSYGFRPGLSPHDALGAIGRTICRNPMAYVLEADIQGYFDAIVRSQLMAFVERRIGDSSILRLIRKWIHVGVIEDGRLRVTQTGTGQGQVISPLLANIYLHDVLDEWFEHEVKPRLRGQAAEIRYADDCILCFQYREDAERVLAVLTKRFAKYGLTLHPEKTRLLAFGRSALPRHPNAPKPDLRFPRLHAPLCAQPGGTVCDSHPDHPHTPSPQREGGGAMVPATSA
jgi:RNA-directed DNA polymerase